MGTNSKIFYEKNPNEFHGISCYFDGYLNGVGATLYKHYRDLNKIKKLISLGDISSLDKECEVNPRYQLTDSYNIDQRHNGYTFAYHRDCGRKLEPPIIKNSLDEMINDFHVYVWKDNNWFSYNYEEKKWRLLEDELIELSKESSRNHTYIPKTVEIVLSYEEYITNIRRGFLIVKKDNFNYSLSDYIKFKATKKNHQYELLLNVIDIVENEGIKDGYQLIILSRPSADFAWYNPVIYV